MTNVVYVDFSAKNIEPEVFGITTDLAAYLDELRKMGIEEDDILETIDAINNVDAYFAADAEVQTFANGWIEQFL